MASDPDYLWHYTDGAALLSIASTSVLRATQIQYLNDFEELTHLAVRMVEFAATSGGATQEDKDLATFLVQALRVPHLFPLCITSFTALRDDLSQWRAYSPHGHGYAIGLRTDELRAWVTKQPAASNGVPWRLTPVVYDEKLKDALNESLLNIARRVRAEEEQGVRAMSGPITAEWVSENPYLPAPLTRMLRQTMDIGPTMKNASFAAEREWRVVTPPMRSKDLKVRPAATMLAPYTELNLGSDVPIRKVMVGPGPHADLNMAALQNVTDLGGDVEISKSRIPFRNW